LPPWSPGNRSWFTAAGSAIIPGNENAILAKTFGRVPADEMLKTMFLINALPDK